MSKIKVSVSVSLVWASLPGRLAKEIPLVEHELGIKPGGNTKAGAFPDTFDAYVGKDDELTDWKKAAILGTGVLNEHLEADLYLRGYGESTEGTDEEDGGDLPTYCVDEMGKWRACHNHPLTDSKNGKGDSLTIKIDGDEVAVYLKFCYVVDGPPKGLHIAVPCGAEYYFG